MIFADTAVEQAEGAILVHSVALPDGKMKKGRQLSAGDIERLRAAGIASVTVVRLEADDVAEDEAATAIAQACRGEGVERQAAFTGRCNLFAEARGVAVIDRSRVDALNALDEAVTIATVPPYEVVEPGQMLATVKIIPFAAPAAAVAAAEKIAGDGGPLVAVAPFRPRQAGLVMTRLPDTRDRVLDKTVQVLSDRLARYGSSVAQEDRCAHEAGEIAAAIEAQCAAGCSPVLLFGASAITDRRDVIPAGIEQAGGVVEHFGMPVDPGNLLLLGRRGDVPVIGLPGCARSPKLNGFDWVLERLVAGLIVHPDDITRMGAGGLLKEIASRPQPRGRENGAEPVAPRAPRIAALVLAAGQSRRMGADNKLLADLGGQPMLRRAVEAAVASQASPVLVVTGHEAGAVARVLDGLDVGVVHNPAFAEGLSASLRAGIAALPADADGALVMLGDMPRIGAGHLDRLIAAFNPVEGRAICVPVFRGKRGNPVLFARSLFEDMRTLAGDVGARHLIGQHEDLVAEVPLDDDAIFVDVDTPKALSAERGIG